MANNSLNINSFINQLIKKSIITLSTKKREGYKTVTALFLFINSQKSNLLSSSVINCVSDPPLSLSDGNILLRRRH